MYWSKLVPADELYSKFSSNQGGAAGLEVYVGPTGSSKSYPVGGLAVLLQCCECAAILTSSTPSQSLIKHFSWDVPSILRCKRAREGQLTAADVAPVREAAKALAMRPWISGLKPVSHSPKTMHLLLMHTISCSRERNGSAWGKKQNL
jgi:hypothetical protein